MLPFIHYTTYMNCSTTVLHIYVNVCVHSNLGARTARCMSRIINAYAHDEDAYDEDAYDEDAYDENARGEDHADVYGEEQAEEDDEASARGPSSV